MNEISIQSQFIRINIIINFRQKIYKLNKVANFFFKSVDIIFIKLEHRKIILGARVRINRRKLSGSELYIFWGILINGSVAFSHLSIRLFGQ